MSAVPARGSGWELEAEVSGPEGPRRQLLRVDEVVSVGRDRECELRLDSNLVSRRHARIEVMDAALRVVDQSTNGTAVGGRQVHRSSVEVPWGTPLGIGEYVLRLQPARVSPPAAGATPAALRRELRRQLIEHLDLATLNPARREDPELRPRVLDALRGLVAGLGARLPAGCDGAALVAELADEALGLGPLERLLADSAVTEIMVVDPETIYVERDGKLSRTTARFTDEDRVRAVIERIVAPLGRRIDEASPLVDARLSDGARVNIVIRPLALRGSCITIRRFARTPLTLERLCALGSLSPQMGRFLERCVRARKNILVSGGTSSGKTTLLNVLSAAIPATERIVTIEDAAELRLAQPHVVSLETRPANLEGRGELRPRDLVRNAMRMRPDRIVVGECRGGEALDMLQAMNTGHDGSLTTTHANSPEEAIARLETLALMADVDLPARAIREQIATSVHVIVHQQRLADGTRKVSAIAEVTGMAPDGHVGVRPLFEFHRRGLDAHEKVVGEFLATGYLPAFIGEFGACGLLRPGESYL